MSEIIFVIKRYPTQYNFLRARKELGLKLRSKTIIIPDIIKKTGSRGKNE